MKFKSKTTGTVVEPANDIAAQTFIRSKDWVKIKEPKDADASVGGGNQQPQK